MTKEELHQTLNSGRLSKKRIDDIVGELEHHPELVNELLKAIWIEDKEGTFNASWVFDHLMRRRLTYLLPYIENFTSHLKKLQSESCIRPIGHVCQMITEAYFKKKDPRFLEHISEKHLDRLVTTCFDWLIGQHKIAAKVFAMTSLFYLGEKFDWIRPELKLVLEQTVFKGTAGYKNRAQKTLAELQKLGY